MIRSIMTSMVAAGLCFAALAGGAFGQSDYPNRPIEFVVPSGAGGALDTTARIVSKYFADKHGITLNVVNKVGGGHIIGTHYALNAAPDGYTLLADSHGLASLLGAITPDLPFDWRARTWIAKISDDIPVYLVQADSPWHTMEDVAKFAKENPGQLRWGVAGVSGVGAAAIGQFFRASDVPFSNVESTRVSFKSGADVVGALAGGHIDFAAQQASEAVSMIEGDKVRALAVVSPERLPQLPEVPTVGEAGYPMLDVFGWHGMSAPPGIPAEVEKFWLEATAKAFKDPAFVDMLVAVNKVPSYVPGSEFAAFNEAEYDKYVDIFKYFGIEAN